MDIVEANERGFDESVRHPWELARLDVVKKLISENISLQKDSVVLDIGCGDTFVVENLALKYPHVQFYAIDTAFTNDLINNFNSRLKSKNVFLFRSQDEITAIIHAKVSLVLLMDVIEHIQNEIDFLRDLLAKNFIGKETFFLITVPAYQALFCSHDEFLGHYRRYSNKLLHKHVEISGLKVIDIGYFFFSLLPIRILQVIKEIFFKKKPAKNITGLTEWSGGKLKSNLFKQLLKTDASFSLLLKTIGIRLPGLSNYVICKKSA